MRREGEGGGLGAPTGADNNEASHMLLYLNEDTFVGAEGEAFADEVRCTLTRTLTLHPHRSPPTRTRTRTRTLTRCAARSPTASRW